MIKLSELKESDIGRQVIYQPKSGGDRGKISSWNNKFVFVNWEVYPGQYMDSFGCVAAATYPEDLDFVQSGEAE